MALGKITPRYSYFFQPKVYIHMCYGIANGSNLMNSQIFLKAFLCCLPKPKYPQNTRERYQIYVRILVQVIGFYRDKNCLLPVYYNTYPCCRRIDK